MQTKIKQIKINIPAYQKSVLAYCDFLSGQRLLSKVVIKLLQDEMQRRNCGASKLATPQQQSFLADEQSNTSRGSTS